MIVLYHYVQKYNVEFLKKSSRVAYQKNDSSSLNYLIIWIS